MLTLLARVVEVFVVKCYFVFQAVNRKQICIVKQLFEFSLVLVANGDSGKWLSWVVSELCRSLYVVCQVVTDVVGQELDGVAAQKEEGDQPQDLSNL